MAQSPLYLARLSRPGRAIPRHAVGIQYFELGVSARPPDGQANKTAKQINERLARGFLACQALNSVKRRLVLEGVRPTVSPHPAMMAAGSVRFGIDHTGCDLVIH